MGTTLGKVMVFVSDVEACAKWYERHFGFPIVEATRIPEQWCELQLGSGLNLAFHRAYIEGQPVTTPTGGPMNPHKLVFAVDDVEQTRARLLSEGVTVFEAQGAPEEPRCDGLDCEQHRFQIVQNTSLRA